MAILAAAQISFFYVVVTMGDMLIHKYGPYAMTFEQCNARVELLTKFYLADPPIYPTDKRWVYQCIERRE